MVYRDSIPPPDTELANIMFKKLRKLIRAINTLVGTSHPKWKWSTQISEGPFQNNCYDCGLFVCLAVRAALLGIPFDAPGDLTTLRLFIQKSLREWPQQSSIQSSQLQEFGADDLFGLDLVSISQAKLFDGLKKLHEKREVD